MIHLCCYFQVHQPKRLRKYTYFDIGQNHFYEADDKNKAILHKVAHKCYLPANKLMLKLIDRYKGAFKIAYSLTGTFIEQCESFAPEVLDSFRELADTGCVEFLNETYYHSLACLFSEEEFKKQVVLHQDLMKEKFGMTSKTFRNTELIYSNTLAKWIEEMGYHTILAEGADHILEWRSPNFAYKPSPCKNLKLLLKNYRLSDDIAFRFSNRGWADFPLTTEKFSRWVHDIKGNGETVNLFMDYETFGEHQWAETGIFSFMENLPEAILSDNEFCFSTPAEVSASLTPIHELDMPHWVSWADLERDLTAWKGNALQDDSLQAIFQLEKKVMQTEDPGIIGTWRSLQTSDHFYYMCTKWFEDGDVHKYFNPYNNPYEAYVNYQNIISDFKENLEVVRQGEKVLVEIN
ncbi:MAG: alpha-amylase [Chlamydiales bacterium]|jgi:alpha-amylase